MTNSMMLMLTSLQQKVDQHDESQANTVKMTTRKMSHYSLILDGVCTYCAHCGHQLTDSVSIQRGIGPICSKKGYGEDPVDGDEIQAMIDLAGYPELVEFLVKHCKPLGLRGLMNGLVRIASLNRPRNDGSGDASVHSACCDAIYSLGHKTLASLLRESLVVFTLQDSETYPGKVEIWVKKNAYSYSWARSVHRDLWGWFSSKKCTVIPMHNQDDKSDVAFSNLVVDGKRLTNKRVLWNLILEHFEGRVARINGTVMKLERRKTS